MPWWVQFLVMLAVVAAIGALVGYYVHRRFSQALRLRRRGRRWLGWTMALGPMFALGSRLLHVEWLALPMGTIGYAINLSILLMLPILIVEQLLRGGLRVLRLRRRSDATKREARSVDTLSPTIADAVHPSPSDMGTAAVVPSGSNAPRIATPTRRQLLQHAGPVGAAALVMPSVGYGMIFGRRDYDRTQTVVANPKLPANLDGLRVVQLSDIHFGPYITGDELRAAISLLRDAKPDLVALTGDLVDHDPNYAHFVGRLAEAAREFSRFGVVAVSGNHDYYAGVEDVKDALHKGGAEVLSNRHVTVGDAGGQIVVAGVDDVWASRARPGEGPDLPQALRKAPDDTFRLLLCHQPRFFEESSAHVDLQISGHTHGGQIEPAGHLAGHILPHGWVEGRYERGDASLYVNRGFGTAGPPVRIGAPPEVSTIILTRS